LSRREGLGLSLPPTELTSVGFRRFWKLEMPIFHYAGSRKRNGGERRSAVRRVVARVCNRRVRSLAGPARPVSHPEESTVRKDDRTRGASGHTRSDVSDR
jgi:hypothetical protein